MGQVYLLNTVKLIGNVVTSRHYVDDRPSDAFRGSLERFARYAKQWLVLVGSIR